MAPTKGRLTRRGLLAGALLTCGPVAARAGSPSGSGLAAYEAQLRARLEDAGGGAFAADFAQALLTETNRFRAAQRLGPYRWHDGLAACARAHAADMARRDYFAHHSPEGFSHLERAALLARDLCGETAENLAWRGGADPSPAAFERLWEDSPGHRRNLLREGYSHAGYGVVQVDGRCYAAGVYAEASVRLARPLPLRLRSTADLEPALVGASPAIDRMAFTAPFAAPTWAASGSGAAPALQPGVWQLRPMRATGGARFDVLTGPLFFVG